MVKLNLITEKLVTQQIQHKHDDEMVDVATLVSPSTSKIHNVIVNITDKLNIHQIQIHG